MNETVPTIVVDEPALVFGGCYGNLPATRALLDAARDLDIPPERTISTGDLVAYCAEPAETVALVREAGIPVVAGNCEEQIAAGAADCGCGFAEGSACDTLSAAWYPYTRERIDAETAAWMEALPKRIDLEVRTGAGSVRLAVVHAAPSGSNRFVFASTPEAVLAEELALAGTDGVIAGHSGLPFTRLTGGRLWHNTGALGMPANDGTPRVWFAVLTPTADGVILEHRALTYDHPAAAATMRRAGLPEGYARALETGLWPSLDVLPETEREMTGRALAPPALTFLGRALAPLAG